MQLEWKNLVSFQYYLQENQVKRFVRIGWGIMIMLGIGREVVSWGSKGRQDISQLGNTLSFFLVFLILARTLVLGDQIKYYIYMTIGIWYVFAIVVGTISFQIVYGFQLVTTFIIFIIYPILFFFLARVMIIFAIIIQYEYKENIKQTSSILSGQFFRP